MEHYEKSQKKTFLKPGTHHFMLCRQQVNLGPPWSRKIAEASHFYFVETCGPNTLEVHKYVLLLFGLNLDSLDCLACAWGGGGHTVTAAPFHKRHSAWGTGCEGDSSLEKLQCYAAASWLHPRGQRPAPGVGTRHSVCNTVIRMVKRVDRQQERGREVEAGWGSILCQWAGVHSEKPKWVARTYVNAHQI